MSKQIHLDFDGQSVTQDDYNLLGQNAGLSDDKLLAEFFRMAPNTGTVSRGVLPYSQPGHSTENAFIDPNGASGSVNVNPFRALIGSTSFAAVDAVDNWQGIRTGISIADGAVSLSTNISFAANASGSSRWDAIYAVVTIDASSTPVLRKVKNPGTSVVSDQSVSVYKYCPVSVSSVAGTPAGSPTFPAIPADAGSVYYILLAYVRIPNGFSAGSTVLPADINLVAPCISVSRAMGVATLQPASGNNNGGAGVSSAGSSARNGILAWTGTAGSRPACYIPPSMQGMESRIIAMDLCGASSANWSHVNNDIVDNSINWHNRLFKWYATVGAASGSVGDMPWLEGTTDVGTLLYGNALIPTTNTAGTLLQAQQWGFGQSITKTAGQSFVMALKGGTTVPSAIQASTTIISLVVDSSGVLRVNITGVPTCSVIIWLDATAPYDNY